MLALAARRMGYRLAVLSPEPGSPTGQVADRELVAPYDDLDAVRRLAAGADVVTVEFENVPASALAAAAELAPVHPSPEVLAIAQHRLREKSWLAARGFPTPAFRRVAAAADLAPAIAEIGLPGLLKTAGFGYDGKGQRPVARAGEAEAAWRELGGGEAIYERRVAFRAELSVVAVRSAEGGFASYGPIANHHVRGILDLSVAPAGLPEPVAREAVDLARAIAGEIGLVGVLCVEMFWDEDGSILVNELAPRPHNSGHLTIEASVTSQFEQQLRAICALPLGDPGQRAPAAMANLLGELWWPDPRLEGEPREPAWAAALRLPDVHLHLYGKAEPRPGRKMGHLTALASDPEAARALALAARGWVTGGPR
jgi:5-(carboxyamino)imidazole ribonucleotide synthase